MGPICHTLVLLLAMDGGGGGWRCAGVGRHGFGEGLHATGIGHRSSWRASLCHRDRPPRHHGGPRRAGEMHRNAPCCWGRRSPEQGSQAIGEGLRRDKPPCHWEGHAGQGTHTAVPCAIRAGSPSSAARDGRGVVDEGRCREGPPPRRAAAGEGEAKTRVVSRRFRARGEERDEEKIGRHFCWPNESR
jgi:hypothetical protein